jgi:hypothetical protein
LGWKSGSRYCRDVKKLTLHPEVNELRAVYLEVEKIYLTWEELEKLLRPSYRTSRPMGLLFVCPLPRASLLGHEQTYLQRHLGSERGECDELCDGKEGARNP